MDNFDVNYHASVCINKEIYVDPLKVEGEPHNAKVVCITHPHWDHLSIEDIRKVANEDTHFIAPVDCIDILKDNGFDLENQRNYWAVGGKSFDKMYHDGKNVGYQVRDMDVWVLAFPSYNIDKKFHPKDENWVGYIITTNGVRYVVCGDTDWTPELKKIKGDVAFVPIGGKYTMNAAEAAECINAMKPKVAVPIHYMLESQDGSVLGSKHDKEVFAKNVNKKIEVKTFF